MILNNFSVQIPEGNENVSGYVEMKHGKQYKIQLRNFHNVDCDAEVSIDGQVIGCFRINAKGSLSLERPVNDNGKFTFYESGTIEANKAQIKSGNSFNGLISVTFTPEKNIRPLQANTISVRRLTHYGTGTPFSINTNTTSTTVNLEGFTNLSGDVTYTSSNSYSEGATGLSGNSNQQFQYVEALDYDYSLQTTINLRLVGKKKMVAVLS